MFANKISSFLWLSLLLPSAILLAFILQYSSNPFTFIRPKQGLISEGNESLGGEKPASCDLFVGRWAREAKGSLYTSSTCSMLPEMKNCAKYGKDHGYVYWRWRPDGCELPRFDPMTFLSNVREKKMAFVGDSLARNQMESLLCLLSQAEAPVDIYKDPSDKFRTWFFPSHNFTLMVMWSQFLVEATERIVNGTASNTFDIHLDRPNTKWAEKLPELHYIAISAGNWFFRTNYLYDNGTLIGCIGCTDKNLTAYSIAFATRRVFGTTLQFISKCKECDDELVTLLRTFSPPHFEHGSWFTGGYCNRTRPLDDNELSLVGSGAMELRKIQLEELVRVREGEVRGKKRFKFEALDVTMAMMARADGHPGSHLNRKWNNSSINDCLHWCLPGPIDMWNDVLLETIKRN